MQFIFFDHKTICALRADLKALANDVLRVVGIIAKVIFNFLKTCMCNVGSAIVHGIWYRWKTPRIPKGQDWVEISQIPNSQGGPILFVHGWYGKPFNFYGLATQMRKEGCKRPLYAIHLPKSHKEGFESSGSKVAQAANQILQEQGAQKISLIGHSYGGVHVAQAACLGKCSIDQITTIASPMQGTDIATLPGLRDMTRENLGSQSEKLRALNRELGGLEVRIHHLVSGGDCIVFPPDAQRSTAPHGAAYKYKGPRGHLGILDDLATAALLTRLHRNSVEE